MSLASKLISAGLDDRWKTSSLSLVATHTGFNGGGIPFFKPDGSKLFAHQDSTNVTSQYALSTPWDVSSASLINSPITGYANGGPFFSSDGLRFYQDDGSGSNLDEYSLSVAWDLSSTRTLENRVDLGIDSREFFFREDGSQLFIAYGFGTYSVNKYTLSTPWDISTLSLDQTKAIVSDDLEGTWFKPDGSKMYTGTGGTGSSRFREYTLSTPWDVSTLSFNVGSEALDRGSFYIKPDGSRLYKFSNSSGDLQEYSMG